MKRDKAIFLMLAGVAAGCKSTRDFGLQEDRVDKTRRLIEKAVPDGEQRKAMLAVVDSLQREMEGIETRALTLRDQIVEMNRNYDVSRPEMEPLYSRLGGLTVQLGNAANSLELRALCSQAEWRQIAAHKTESVHFTF